MLAALRRMTSVWPIWRRNMKGGIAVSFALSLPLLFGIFGIVTDYALMTRVRSDLQSTADAAALAGAREIPMAMSNVKQVASAVRSFAAYRLAGNSAASVSDLSSLKLSLEVAVIEDFSAVKVTISEAWSPFFMHFFDGSVTPVNVTSQARFVGRNNICVLGLSGSGNAVYLDKGAKLTGNNCGAFSNSTSRNALQIAGGAVVKAMILCSAGGISVSASANVTPVPITDCPPVEDPLARRIPPDLGGCDHYKTVVNSQVLTLQPGVYCGGISLQGNSEVTFEPGIYELRDGGLSASGHAALKGEGVGFYLSGNASPIVFGSGTHVSLTAPTEGAMAGLLIFEDPRITVKMKHRITSDDARVLLGTIYLPVGTLLVDAKQPVADQSAYTAIVAQSLELNGGPNLVLNANYDMTNVPVPAGIAGSSQVILSN